MIHMWMGHNNVPHRVALLVANGEGDTSSVNRHAIIDQKTAETLLRRGVTFLVKCAW